MYGSEGVAVRDLHTGGATSIVVSTHNCVMVQNYKATINISKATHGGYRLTIYGHIMHSVYIGSMVAIYLLQCLQTVVNRMYILAHFGRKTFHVQ